MRASKSSILVALAAAAAALAVPEVALANGGHLHVGATSIPLAAVYGVGGFVGVVMLFFVANWARYRRSLSRGGPLPGPGESQERDGEEGDGTRADGE